MIDFYEGCASNILTTGSFSMAIPMSLKHRNEYRPYDQTKELAVLVASSFNSLKQSIFSDMPKKKINK